MKQLPQVQYVLVHFLLVSIFSGFYPCNLYKCPFTITFHFVVQCDRQHRYKKSGEKQTNSQMLTIVQNACYYDQKKQGRHKVSCAKSQSCLHNKRRYFQVVHELFFMLYFARDFCEQATQSLPPVTRCTID